MRRIREQTGDGEEIADYMLRVFRDEKEATKTRIEAASWLADRGFGRAVQPTRRLDEPELSLDRVVGEMSPDERRVFEKR